MEVLQLISAVAASLNAAPNTALADVVQVVTTLTTFLETLHKQQQAAKAPAVPAASAPVASPTQGSSVAAS